MQSVKSFKVIFSQTALLKIQISTFCIHVIAEGCLVNVPVVAKISFVPRDYFLKINEQWQSVPSQ
jgi:hypothetical protein